MINRSGTHFFPRDSSTVPSSCIIYFNILVLRLFSSEFLIYTVNTKSYAKIMNSEEDNMLFFQGNMFNDWCNWSDLCLTCVALTSYSLRQSEYSCESKSNR